MTGLTNEQVQERIAEGKVNVNENPNTRTYKQIILENTLTFFNFLNIALLVLVLFVRSYKNSMFMGIILINTVIGIIQEIRAKKTIDKLAILTESKTVVLREGKKWSISTEKLVLDDLKEPHDLGSVRIELVSNPYKLPPRRVPYRQKSLSSAR